MTAGLIFYKKLQVNIKSDIIKDVNQKRPARVATNPKGGCFMKKFELTTSKLVALVIFFVFCVLGAFVIGRKSAKAAYTVKIPSNVTLYTASGAELDDNTRAMMETLGYKDVEFHPYCMGGRVLESPKGESGLSIHTELDIYHVHWDDIVIVESADGVYSYCEAVYGEQSSNGWVFSHKRGETYVHATASGAGKAYIHVYVFNIELNTVYRLY